MGRLKIITHRYLSLSLYGHYVEVVFKSEFSNTQFHHLQCQTHAVSAHMHWQFPPGERMECVVMSQRRVQNTLNPLLIEKKNSLQWLAHGYCLISAVASQGQRGVAQPAFNWAGHSASARKDGARNHFSVCRDRRFNAADIGEVHGVRPASLSRALPHTIRSELLHTKLCRKLVRKWNPRWRETRGMNKLRCILCRMEFSSFWPHFVSQQDSSIKRWRQGRLIEMMNYTSS